MGKYAKSVGAGLAIGAALGYSLMATLDFIDDLGRGVYNLSKKVRKVGGRRPINYKYAGKVHPSGVKFTKEGFPDFSPYAVAEVKSNKLTGDHRIDVKFANEKLNLPDTPEGFTWHHVEDGITMQLVPEKIHDDVRHTGGVAVIKHKDGG